MKTDFVMSIVMETLLSNQVGTLTCRDDGFRINIFTNK